MLNNFVTRLAFSSLLLGTFAQAVPSKLYCVGTKHSSSSCQAGSFWETAAEARKEIRQPHHNSIYTVDTQGIEDIFTQYEPDSKKWSNTRLIPAKNLKIKETRFQDGRVNHYN
ncbi:hypothetical protein MGG_17556 [Pyricularia oryzae 70-15]|uniref:Uncharacterized protein n=1 Tax=Pyricularia oryzae (strain 70-15 / ATCC MYA-4617 / FGSC 8958) TaxID=242507 RepID=G4NFH1_PYRO7|nr:uncharacterized protein MGG_17556 [Pyricularia oryzae 70-15]EHA46778.1 hypothetical protein MGG_17556 [Pyricularia oryzae 70-15]